MAEIGEVVVALRIFGDELDPPEISTLLGATPTAVRKKGDIRTVSSGQRVVARTGLWEFKAGRRSPGDLDTQVGHLFSLLSPDLTAWQHLAERYECRVDCGLFMRERNESGELRPETLALLVARGVVLTFDIYDPIPD